MIAVAVRAEFVVIHLELPPAPWFNGPCARCHFGAHSKSFNREGHLQDSGKFRRVAAKRRFPKLVRDVPPHLLRSGGRRQVPLDHHPTSLSVAAVITLETMSSLGERPQPCRLTCLRNSSIMSISTRSPACAPTLTMRPPCATAAQMAADGTSASDWVRCSSQSPRGLLWLATEIVLDGLDQGHQLALIAAALREFVRDNDLGVSVDRCLCVMGLDEAFLRLHDAAVRIGEVALRLGIRFVR